MTTSDTFTELYALPQEHIDFRDAIRQIVTERVAPRAAEIDAKAEYPQDLRELFAEHDLFGLPFDTEHGGTGKTRYAAPAIVLPSPGKKARRPHGRRAFLSDCPLVATTVLG